MSVPVVFFAFANDRDAHLDLLKEEAGAVRDVFRQLVEQGQVEFHREESATIDEVFDALTYLRNRLQVFHYAGHAGAASLDFEGGAASAAGIAQLLGSERELKLVFLNGCATRPQVEALWNAGVPAVIATSVPINDKKAAEFSTAFYKSLANGWTLGDAFDRAGAFLRTNYGDGARVGQVHRTLRLAVPHFEDARDAAGPWGLWVNPDGASDMLDWSLPRVTESPSHDESEAPRGTSEQALPPPLDEPVKTRDGDDEIRLRSRYTPGLSGVKLCLELEDDLWWKRVEIGSPERKLDKTEFRPGIEGHGPGLKDCMVIDPPCEVMLHFRKARFLGRKAGSVNEKYMDLTKWNEHTLTFSWISD